MPIHCSYKKLTELSHWLIVNFVVSFAVPLLIISACYSQIIWKISKPMTSGKILSLRPGFLFQCCFFCVGTTSQSSNRTRKRITYMVTALVLVFFVCWFPYYVFNLARVNDLKVSKYTCDFLRHFTLVLAYMNR